MPAVSPALKVAPPELGAWHSVAWAAVGAAGLTLLCSKWYGPDIWYHLYLGDRVIETQSAQPADSLVAKPALFINIYWLFQIAISAIHRVGGVSATAWFFIVTWGVAFGGWLKTAGAWRAGPWGAIAALAAILVCQPRFDPRPEVVSYALLALQLYWLGAWDFSGKLPWLKFAMFALAEAVWANVHGYFVFGPLLVGARLLAAMVQPADPRGERGAGVRTLTLLLTATMIATIVSPLGWRTWECVALLTKTLRELRGDIQEFYPPTQFNLRLWTVKLFWFYWVFVLLGTLVALCRAPRRSLFAIFAAAAGLVLGPLALRNLPLLVFLSAPVMAETLSLLPRARRFVPFAYASIIAGAVALAAWTVGGGFYESLRSQSTFGVGESPGAFPTRFVAYLRSTRFEGKLFNAARDGGYLEFHVPGVRVYGDSRFVDPSSVREYFAGVTNPDVFRRLHALHQFDGVLLPLDLGRDVIGTLLRDAKWKLAYADLHRAFLINLDSPAASALPPPQLEFYRGEDLASIRHGAFASQWIALLTLANDRTRLMLALNQLSAAPALPSFVGEFALRYAHGSADREIVQLIRALRAKFFALTPEDQRELDQAIADTAAL